MKRAAAILLVGAMANSLLAADFAFGADLSFLKQAEDSGKIFKDGTNALPGDPLEKYFSDKGKAVEPYSPAAQNNSANSPVK